MIEQVIAEYVDHALQTKNNPQLDLTLKTEVMLKMAQALGTLVPLVGQDQAAEQQMKMQQAQQQMLQAQQQHDMNMRMQADKHSLGLQQQQQKHALQMELSKQKQNSAKSPQNSQ